VIEPGGLPVNRIQWDSAVRIIRSAHPPIDVFEDIAAPEDWPRLIAAEQKTNPRLMETLGQIDLVPPDRRVGGPGASYLMAPFTHTSPDRPSRFTDGRLGVLYVARDFETAVQETVHHHARFMAATAQEPGWSSEFREIVLEVDAALHDIRGGGTVFAALLDPDDYTTPQGFAQRLRAAGGQGVVYPSVRGAGACVALFFPDLAHTPRQARHLGYHWDGARVDLLRDKSSGQVYRITP